jgi:hypothetical protein
MKRNTRPTVFQPGNKESLTSVDAVNAAGRAIPSFLILSAKVLLEEYTRADIDDRVVLTFTDTGFNNAQRAVQWLQHFNLHSFAVSESFAGSSIEEWFGYPSTITKKEFNEKYAFQPRFQVKKAPRTPRLLLMDSFKAHENPEFIWYCGMFDIIPFRLPSHTSHMTQPLDVGVYQCLKNEQRGALRDFMIAGGVQISRFDFLNLWNRMYAVAFKACHIYVGLEKSGMFPFNPEAVLGPLRRHAEGLEKPLFPKVIKQMTVTPRKAKRQFDAVRKDVEALLSPAWKAVWHAEACLDLAIVTQHSHEEIIALQKERIRLEARRTRSRRQIRGVTDGAFTISELKRKVEAREEEERKQELKRLCRQQEADFRRLRDDGRSRLRGGAAVKAKKERAAAEAAAMASQEANRARLLAEEEIEVCEHCRRTWKEANKKERDFYYRIWPYGTLEAIPEAAAFLAARRKPAACDEHHDDMPEDVISVSSGGLTPLLPGNDDSDDDEIEVITSTQIESTTRMALAAGKEDISGQNSEEEEDLSQHANWGGFGHNRVRNSYSDDEEV